ncbi:hypothetical protein [Amycolatopsis sacchari]|uniref:Uncharacterized protein n=1 Tax=Amycolatopsis sacchari TaxID=115433 RepID=A0A1I3V9Q6_9PSEU|nr:hypothetical protein [Amycolatopsis sacchari]SFJ91860.1 hypothetical protein SAMN05421835_110211 [Amycolatopsis sacchari]
MDLLAKQLRKNDELVTGELTRHWLRKGERLGFGTPPLREYVRSNIGGQVRLPHQPVHPVPAFDLEKLGKPRWPLPSPEVLEEDWTDDPTVGHFVYAHHPDQLAVHFADHFANSHGEARLVVSDRRVAVVYPSKFLGTTGELFTTFCETDPRQVRLSAPFAGRSAPPPRVVRVDFADGSALLLRAPFAGELVARATVTG